MTNILERKAIIVHLIRKMREQESWTGETHIQKCTYFLENFLKVDLAYNFILYKHGPFSFDLRDELTELRADNYIEMQPRKPFGPSFKPGKFAEMLEKRYKTIIDRSENYLDFIVHMLANKSVKELERVATALYVKNNEDVNNDNEIIEKIIEFKPHISKVLAKEAVNELNTYFEEAEKLIN